MWISIKLDFEVHCRYRCIMNVRKCSLERVQILERDENRNSSFQICSQWSSTHWVGESDGKELVEFGFHWDKRSSGPRWMIRIVLPSLMSKSLIFFPISSSCCPVMEINLCPKRSIPGFRSIFTLTVSQSFDGSISIGQTYQSRFFRNTRISPSNETEDQRRRCFFSLLVPTNDSPIW